MSDTPGVSTMVPPDEPIEQEEVQELQFLGREAILASDDTKIEPLDVPEWKCKVYVRVMSGQELGQFDNEHSLKHETMKTVDFRERLLVSTLCDEHGQLVFNSKDIQALSKKSGSAITRVVDVALRLNMLGKDNVEGLAGNSGSGQSDDSGSA